MNIAILLLVQEAATNANLIVLYLVDVGEKNGIVLLICILLKQKMCDLRFT